MAALKGKKPLIDKRIYDLAVEFLKKVDKHQIPDFVKKFEKKETYLAEHLSELCKIISETHAKRLKKEHNINLSSEHQSSIALDLYIIGWFSYLILDLANDINFEEYMKSMYGGD